MKKAIKNQLMSLSEPKEVINYECITLPTQEE
jgi:hypothetical protein